MINKLEMDEKPIERLRDILAGLNQEDENVLMRFPTIESLLEYDNLLYELNEMDLNGIHQGMIEGKDYVDLVAKFCDKHNTHWMLSLS